MKWGDDAPGSGSGRGDWCVDGPQRKKVTETSMGCGDGDVCNDSRADGAGVTRETCVWTCPPSGCVHCGASAEPGPEDYVDWESSGLACRGECER